MDLKSHKSGEVEEEFRFRLAEPAHGLWEQRTSSLARTCSLNPTLLNVIMLVSWCSFSYFAPRRDRSFQSRPQIVSQAAVTCSTSDLWVQATTGVNTSSFRRIYHLPHLIIQLHHDTPPSTTLAFTNNKIHTILCKKKSSCCANWS